jgi:hypothetical protein
MEEIVVAYAVALADMASKAVASGLGASEIVAMADLAWGTVASKAVVE